MAIKQKIQTLKNQTGNLPAAGRGIDMDPEDDPTYPMRQRFEGDNKGIDWERPVQQAEDVEILKSTERPSNSAVFGTTVPPRGLSGMIRRQAYKFSESSMYRWFPLVLADRVDMVEGLISDLLHGHVPNLWKEKGMNAELKHNPKGIALRAGAYALIGYGLFRYLKNRKEK